MCGILGLIKVTAQQDDVHSLSLGIDVLDYRGPDGRGSFLDESVELAHVRLSILDLTDAGAQPFSTPSKRFILTYNGEVYNFEEIAKELRLHHRFSGTDTEVIALGFEKIGPALFQKLNGMFALGIYDQHLKKLWLVRDRFGIKPIYYKSSNDGFWFSSEIKGIFAMGGGEPCFSLNEVHEWSYYGANLGEKTLYQNIKSLLPGHYLEVDVQTGKTSLNCYWKPSQKTQDLSIRSDLLIRKTHRLLEQAVQRQLVSDVPIGVFLSGGVDSSAITAFASKHYDKQLTTYSVAFDFDKGESELPMARLVAEKFGTQHHEVYISGADIADVVEKMVYHHDSPFSDAANIPLYLLCREIKDETKVVLQGDGGDELFGGYQRYHTLSHIKKMKWLARAGRLINALTPKNETYYRRRRYINALLSKDEATMMALLLTVEDRADSPLLIFSEKYRKRFEKNDPFSRYREVAEIYKDQPLVDRMFSIDQAIILPDVFLEKVDKASMAASVEVRVPFLDNDLVDFCMSLSYKQKLGPGQQKWLLKKALEGVVPSEILYGKKKGFGVPYGYWIKSSLMTLFHDHLSEFSKKNESVLDLKYINSIFESHRTGRRDYGFLLWKVLNFLIWSNKSQIRFICE